MAYNVSTNKMHIAAHGINYEVLAPQKAEISQMVTDASELFSSICSALDRNGETISTTGPFQDINPYTGEPTGKPYNVVKRIKVYLEGDATRTDLEANDKALQKELENYEKTAKEIQDCCEIIDRTADEIDDYIDEMLDALGIEDEPEPEEHGAGDEDGNPDEPASDEKDLDEPPAPPPYNPLSSAPKKKINSPKEETPTEAPEPTEETPTPTTPTTPPQPTEKPVIISSTEVEKEKPTVHTGASFSGGSIKHDAPKEEVRSKEEVKKDLVASVLDNIVSGKKYNKIPTSASVVKATPNSKSGGSGTIPVISGITSASAVGLGVKTLMDYRKSKEEEEEKQEYEFAEEEYQEQQDNSLEE